MTTALRVLIIDDEPRARSNLLHLLRSEADVGEPRTCSGGEEAVEILGSFAPDLVFLDVQMPEVGGFELFVEDDGPGPAATLPTGIGLSSTRARLHEAYGEAASLALVRRDGGGARASIRLPG